MGLLAITFGPDMIGSATSFGSPATVTFTLTGSARSASITYTDSAGNIQQAANVDVPLVRTSGEQGITIRVPHGTFVSFSAQNVGATGDLDCKITADGKVVNTGHSQGGYAIASCSVVVP
jgi:hypothetical protein